METKRRGVYRLFDHLLVIGLAVMALMVFGNVVLRYLFNSGLEFSEEVSRFIFVWLTFIGSVVALKDGLHLGVDTLVRRLPYRGRLAFYWISHALMLLCCVLLWQGSWEQARVNLTNMAPVSGVPIAVVYASGLFAAAFMGWILVMGLWRSLMGGLSNEELIAVKESEDLPCPKGKEA